LKQRKLHTLHRPARIQNGHPPLIFVHGGYAAEEPGDYLQREGFDRCTARDVVLERALATCPGGFDHVELYSCFPCVPKAARRTLGLGRDDPCTVAGGLTFFGAPLNNYMSHALAAMGRRLRNKSGVGLLYGQGGFMTKHHALIVGTAPAEKAWVMQPPALSVELQQHYGDCPTLVIDAEGEAVVETHTFAYDRDGGRRGVVMLRLDAGAKRTLAAVAHEELDVLENDAAFAIGRRGHVSTPPGGVPIWRFGA